jgi:hypothetical protein
MADEEKPSMDHLTFSAEEEEGIVKIQAMVTPLQHHCNTTGTPL